MKVFALAAASIAAWSASAIAADISPVTQPIPVRDTVAYMEALYQGEVVAIELDAAGDKAALASVIQRVSALVEIIPELRELDLNPVKVLAPGEGAIVVDGRMRVGPLGMGPLEGQ